MTDLRPLDPRSLPIRPEALSAPFSGIIEISDYGRDRQGLIPLWVGEGDLPTPDFIRDAATRSLAAGDTFYTAQAGILDFRKAIAAYLNRVYPNPASGVPVDPNRIYATIGGMHALQIAIRMVAGPGDEVIVPTPAWPNFQGALAVIGAGAVEVPMSLDGEGGHARWHLDLDRIGSAISPRTKAIVVNSPANPTGWVASRAELAAILDLARKHGLWIVADEIYGRFMFDVDLAPSFRDVMEADDRIFFVQTFSKNWAMTGWRIGWLEAPAELGVTIENLVQYSSSGVPVFAQRAAIAALEQGEGFVLHQIARMRQSRDILCDGLDAVGGVRFARPPGAFYLFCAIEREPDTRRLAFRLVDEAGIGIAPGFAFGTGAEPYIRICFARNPEDMREVTRRLVGWLGR